MLESGRGGGGMLRAPHTRALARHATATAAAAAAAKAQGEGKQAAQKPAPSPPSSLHAQSPSAAPQLPGVWRADVVSGLSCPTRSPQLIPGMPMCPSGLPSPTAAPTRSRDSPAWKPRHAADGRWAKAKPANHKKKDATKPVTPVMSCPATKTKPISMCSDGLCDT